MLNVFNKNKYCLTSSSNMRTFAALISLLTLLSSAVFAGTSMPSTFTYQGRLMDSSGTVPLAASLTFYIEVRNPSGNCLLYSEHQPVNTTATAGLFSIQIGNGTRTNAVAGYSNDPGYEFAEIFTNKDDYPAVAGSCPAGWNPGATDARVLRIHVYDGSSTTTLTDQTLSPVPQASVADTIDGVPLQGLTLNWTDATRPANPIANITHGFNRTRTRFEIWNGAAWVPTTPKFSASAIGDTATNNYVLKWNDTTDVWEPADVSSLLGNPGGDVSGTYASMTVEAIQGQPVATTAPNSGEVLKWNGTEWEAATDTGGVPMATGAGTTNRLTKFNASDELADSSVTDDGTTVTFTTPIDMSAQQIKDVANPTDLQDAVTLNYLEQFVEPGTADGDILVWDNTDQAWKPVAQAASVSGSGTQNKVPKWNNAGGTALGDSNITDSGTLVTIGSPLAVQGPLVLQEVAAPTATAGYSKIYPKADNNLYYMDEAGTESQFVFGSGAGEVNTGSNVGAGVGVFKDKSGVDLRFKSLTTGASGTVAITADAGGNEIDIDLAQNGASTGQVMKWTGTAWAPAWNSILTESDSNTTALSVDAAGVVTLTANHSVTNGNDVADKDYVDAQVGAIDGLPAGSTAGEYLKWDGDSWELAADQFINGGNSFGGTATIGTNDAQSLAVETNGTTRMTILSNGNIGVNTATPETAFEVGDWIGAPAGLTANSVSLGVNLYVGNQTANTGRARITANDDGAFFQWNRAYTNTGIQLDVTKPSYELGLDGDADAVYFSRTPAGSVTWSEFFRIEGATGNVGIGTPTTLNERLTVNGAISLAEIAAPTATANFGKLYVKTDNNLYYMTEGGVENQIPFGSGVGEVNTGSSLGGDADVFKQKSVANLEFRGITAGSNISVTENANDITIAATGLQTTLTSGTDTSHFLKWDGDSWEPAFVSSLAASDGTPNPALSVDAAGVVTVTNSHSVTAGNDLTDKDYVDAATGALSPVTDGSATGDILRWDGDSWEPVTMADGTMLMANGTGAVAVAMSQDVTLTNAGVATVGGLQGEALPTVNADGQMFYWDQTNTQWKAADMTGLADGYVMKWDDTAKAWEVGPDAGAAGTVASIEGLAGTINLDNGTTGNAPNWAAAGSDITLHIPLASSAGTVTSGTISNADYVRIPAAGTGTDNTLRWNGTGWVETDGAKIESDGDVVLKNAPTVDAHAATKLYVDNAVSALSPVTDGSATGDILRWDGDSWEPVTMADGTMLMANGTGAVAVTMSGDATITNAGALTIANDAITTAKIDNGAVTREKLAPGSTNGDILKWDGDSWELATDAGGLTDVTGSALEDGKIWVGDGSDLAQEITPSGDATMTNAGVITVGGLNSEALPTLNADGQMFYWDQTNTQWKAVDLTGLADGYVMKWDNTAKSWEVGPDAGASGTVASIEGLTGTINLDNGATGTAPNWAAAGSDVTLHIPLASGVGVTSGTISKADYDSFTGKQDALTDGTSTSQYLKWDGDSWEPALISSLAAPDGSPDPALSVSNAGTVSVTASHAVSAGDDVADKDYVDAATGALSPVTDGSATGDILRWDGDSWEPVTMADGTMLMSNATGAVAVAMSQDVTLTNAGVATVGGLQGEALPTVNADGQMFYWDQTNTQWKAVDLTGLAEGSVMKWDNTAKAWEVGTDAGTAVTGGTQNVLPKFNATGDNITDSSVTDDGTYVLFDNPPVFKDAQIYMTRNGVDTLYFHTTDGDTPVTFSMFIGYLSGNLANTGNSNTAFGNKTLNAITDADYNVAFGSRAGESITTGSNNTIFGANAMLSGSSAANNAAIGWGAGELITTGINNTLIGSQAGVRLTASSSHNVFIGQKAGPTANANISYKLYIDNNETNTPLIYGDFQNDTLTINGDLIVNLSGKYFNYKPNAIECSNDDILKWDATNDRWICTTPTAGGVTSVESQTGAVDMATGSSGTAPAFSGSGGTVTLNIPLASGVGVTSGTISKSDYDRIPAAGTGTNNTMRWSGTAWVETSDLVVTAAGVVSVSNNHAVTGGNNVADKDYVDSATASAVVDVTGGDAITATETTGTFDIDVNVDDSTIEINTDALRLKDAGITFAKIGTNGCSASQVMKRNAGNTAWECAADTDTGTVISGGTQNVVPRFNASGTNIVDGSITDSGASGVVIAQNTAIKGTVNGTYELDVNGDIEADAYFYSSDRRLKQNITTLQSPLEKILRLRGVEFDWIKSGKHEIGLIAQEIEEVYPDLVSTDERGWKAVKYGNLVAPLIGAVQELNEMCTMRDDQMASIDNRLQNAERKIASIEQKDMAQDSKIEQLRRENEELRNQINELKKLIQK